MNIYLKVYLDNNIGDDLMIMGLLKKYPNHNFFAYTNSKEVIETYKSYKNLKFIERNERNSAIRKCDLYLTLGGSVFQVVSFRSLLSKIKKVWEIKVIKKSHAPVLTIGSNLGPFNYPLGKFVTNQELKMNNHITVRDKYSFEYAKKQVDDKVNYVDDIVFEIIEKEKIKHIPKTLGISVYTSSSTKISNDLLREAYVKFVKSYLDIDPEIEIILFAFDTLNENDLKCAEYIKKEVPSDNIKIEAYTGDPEKFLSKFKTCEKMFAMRFHSAILSEIYNIPYTAIAYSNKMSNYIQDNYQKNTMSIDTFIENSLTYELFNSSMISTRERSKLISGHFEVLSKYLSN